MNQGHEVKCLWLDSITPKFRYLFPIPQVGKIRAHFQQHLNSPQEYHYDGVNVSRLKRISPPYKLFWGDDYRFVKFFNHRKISNLISKFEPELIIASGLNPGAALAKMIKDIVNVPYLAILEGSDILLAHKQYRGVEKIIDILNRYADKAVFVSESLKCDALKRFTIKNPAVIANGYDNRVFAYKAERKKRNDSACRIVSVGSLDHVKGHDVLLKSLIGIGIPYHLTLIGEGKKEKEYREIIRRYDLPVDIIPMLPQNKLREYLDSCNLFCMPSRSESFGIAAVEAMACGLPVVAANVGGLRELVIDGFNGYLFEAEAAEALRDGLKKARMNDWRHAEIAGWTAAKFSWDKWAAEILALAAQ
jgi:glycosyltransferase involved in cell wall biosynthesis